MIWRIIRLFEEGGEGGGGGGSGGEGGQKGASGGGGDGGTNLLTDGDKGNKGGGGEEQLSDFHKSLPAEYQKHPGFKDYKDTPSLLKAHVNLQKMLGSDKILKPKDDWTPEQQREWLTELGLPADPNGYKLPEVQYEKGLQRSEKLETAIKGVFHKIGVLPKQASSLFTELVGIQNQQHKEQQAAITADRETRMTDLKNRLGENFEPHLMAAKAAVKVFGDKEGKLVAWLKETGMASDPFFIEFFGNIGSSVLKEDQLKGGGEGGPIVFKMSAEAAQAEIETLKKDRAFQDSIRDRKHPDYAKNKVKWEQLFKAAFPEEPAAEKK